MSTSLEHFVNGIVQNELDALAQREPGKRLWVACNKIKVFLGTKLQSHALGFEGFLKRGVQPLITILEESFSANKLCRL